MTALRKLTMVGLIAAFAGSAFADKVASLDHYGKGKRAYAAGRFEAAIAEFDLAYREFQAPEYLQNIAQALRRLNRCVEAVSYFERFLVEQPAAPNRSSVEAQLAALRAQCPPPSTVATQPDPPVATPPPVEHPMTAARVATVSPPPVASPDVVVVSAPRVHGQWNADATTGIVMFDIGRVKVPPVVQARFAIRYRTGLAADLHVGAALDLAPMPYNDVMTGTLWLGGPQVSADAAYPIRERLSVVASGGLGARIAWGLGEGNPFVDGGRATSAFVMLLVRAELGVAWRATDRIAVRVLPLSFQISPRRAPLASDIGSLRGFAMLVGIDYDL